MMRRNPHKPSLSTLPHVGIEPHKFWWALEDIADLSTSGAWVVCWQKCSVVVLYSPVLPPLTNYKKSLFGLALQLNMKSTVLNSTLDRKCLKCLERSEEEVIVRWYLRPVTSV
jgi:hypothetical protein